MAKQSVPGRDRVLCLTRAMNAPLSLILEPLRQMLDIRVLVWQGDIADEWEWHDPDHTASARGRASTSYAWDVRVGRTSNEREYPRTVTVVSPRLLWHLIRSPEQVIIVRELNAAALYAVMSKVRPGRRIVAKVEGDLGLLGAAGTASAKIALRRIVASFVDVFLANSAGATNYLVGLGVPRRRIIEGWWLAGFDEDDVDMQSARSLHEVPHLVAAGQLIPRKGFDLLLEGVAHYHKTAGRCTLQIIGDGPERAALEQQSERLGIRDDVEFAGKVGHADMRKLMGACDLFMFPTLYDLVGRVAVEALTAGVPVAVSQLSGAAGVLVRDGLTGVVMDPRDPASISAAITRGTDPAVNAELRRGVRAIRPSLTPLAAARSMTAAVERARAS